MSTNPAAFLHDLPVELVIELGRAQLTVADLARLERDDVLELDRLANQTLDVIVGGRLLARGEVVLVDDQVALRITEMIHHEQAETA